MRAVLFCNEMLGLCHLRMSLTLAEALVAGEPDSAALVVTGSPATGAIAVPARVDVVKLPSAPVGAESMWALTSRQAPTALAGEAERVRALRSEISLSVVSAFEPDVVVVDYKPVGRAGDLRAALECCRERDGCTIALGLWDVDDDAARLREQWPPELVEEIATLYDLALVYGTPAEDDVRVQRLSEAGVPVHVTGLVAASRAPAPASDLGSGYLLVVAGGGADGAELIGHVLAAIRLRPLGTPTVVVAGPLMPPAELAAIRDRAAGLDVRVESVRTDMPAVMAGARAVVGMAGYSTVAELLGAGKPAVLVPRGFPRAEQLNRARRLAEAGRVELIEPQTVSPERLLDAIVRVLARAPFERVALTGAADAARILASAGVYP